MTILPTNRLITILLMAFISLSYGGQQTEQSVFKLTVTAPIAAVYDSVYNTLEDNHFFVVFEANIGRNLSRFAGKWGEAYNRSKLTAIRSLVFCNAWYANKVSGEDPDMLGLCPLSATLIEKDGQTTILFLKPTVPSKASPAAATLREVQHTVIQAFQKAASYFKK
ncbi:MAG: DUF302 domain-containing protein [Calditrichaeota bacterium]|nr:MAG: DUF302 domain-containing protein [Calditrichota bacterium]